MTYARLLVFSSPRSTADESAFDEWYDAVHIPQVIDAVPGVVSGRRFVQSRTQIGGATEGPRRRMTVYEVEADRVAEALAGLGAAMRDGRVERSDLIDRSSSPPEVVVYEEA
ncbi:hypothetical protein ASC77_19855 [Nocardioides sp. Root1257]|uniref:hypothetical protein n=1 Tax=unclassified Nocardioides TaxID=2615069 RepID=UPI00070045B8|nr:MULTISPECIES: hypothetical protein [unclassified Nocardioides]KQW45038.1 hypothetical protein ASC77_19855 [Nocardioides sp. Root1257]KRC45958.1 hypothetical protein ASE24_15365 [Nocardioides sp. Root224]